MRITNLGEEIKLLYREWRQTIRSLSHAVLGIRIIQDHLCSCAAADRALSVGMSVASNRTEASSRFYHAMPSDSHRVTRLITLAARRETNSRVIHSADNAYKTVPVAGHYDVQLLQRRLTCKDNDHHGDVATT